MASGALSFPGPAPALTVSPDGRLLHLPVLWGGHAFTLLTAYLPASLAAAQRAFIHQSLRPVAALPGHHIWAADFNFVVDPALDCLAAAGRPARAVTSRIRLFSPLLHLLPSLRRLPHRPPPGLPAAGGLRPCRLRRPWAPL